jgi:hypothetical protein
MNISGKLNQQCVYWAPSGIDLAGNQGFAAPVSFKCRHEAKTEKFLNDSGDEQISNSIFYLNSAVVADGFIMEGNSTAASPVLIGAANEIRKVFSVPSVNANQILYKVLV